MLELLREWAVTLAGIVVFGSMCEVILPEGNFQKYVRLAVGMLLILALVSPVPRLLRLEIPDVFSGGASAEAYQERAEMEERQKADVMRTYQQELAKKLRLTLMSKIEDIDPQVRCEAEESDPARFGNINEVLVILDADTSADVTERIKAILKEEYGIEQKRVSVRYIKEQEE